MIRTLLVALTLATRTIAQNYPYSDADIDTQKQTNLSELTDGIQYNHR